MLGRRRGGGSLGSLRGVAIFGGGSMLRGVGGSILGCLGSMGN